MKRLNNAKTDKASVLLDFDYKIRRSARRKTVAIAVKKGQVEVALPSHVPDQVAHDFVVEKQRWIVSKLQAHQQLAESIPQRQYRNGDYLPWLGQGYLLDVRFIDGACRFSLEHETFQAQMPQTLAERQSEVVRELFQSWCQQVGLELLADKTHKLCSTMGLSISKVKVKASKSRWGWCHSRGEIGFSQQLLMAPEWVIDYVVAHEVCHLVYSNHSARYWQLVARVYPDFEAAKRWLKDNGHLLVF